MKKSSFLFASLIVMVAIVYSVITYHLYMRIGAFGCGDECINYTAGYFLFRDKALYSEIFFNRQPLMAYLSAGVQWIMHPTSLYSLVLAHRAFIAVYSLVMVALLIWRFRLAGALFSLIYVSTSVYSYGNQFIGEAFIVYPLVYLLGIVWESVMRKNPGSVDILLTGIAFLTVFVTREPYIPVAIVLFGAIVYLHWDQMEVRRLLGITGSVVALFFLWLPGTEYYRQVVTTNLATISLEHAQLPVSPVLYAFFYPVFILQKGSLSYFGRIEAGLVIFLLASAGLWWKNTGIYKPLVFIFVVLGFVGIRSVIPGTMYFSAFHMLPWYGLLCMAVALLLTSLRKYRIGTPLVILFILFALWAFAAPKSFIRERVDRLPEFESQYAKYTQYSTAIKILSADDHTVFTDMWDEIIYFESGRNSSFLYSLYIPVEVRVPQYVRARIEMFKNNPPDFYYSCPDVQTNHSSLPSFIASKYTHLLSGDTPGCLYVKKSLQIPQDLWEQVKSVNIFRPEPEDNAVLQ